MVISHGTSKRFENHCSVFSRGPRLTICHVLTLPFLAGEQSILGEDVGGLGPRDGSLGSSRPLFLRGFGSFGSPVRKPGS